MVCRVVDLSSDTAVDGELSETDDGQSEEKEVDVRSLGDEPLTIDRTVRDASTYSGENWHNNNVVFVG